MNSHKSLINTIFFSKINELNLEIALSNYPNALELEGIPNDRYVLAVSINSRRWQGDIIVEQAQTISRTYDVSLEE